MMFSDGPHVLRVPTHAGEAGGAVAMLGSAFSTRQWGILLPVAKIWAGQIPTVPAVGSLVLLNGALGKRYPSAT